MASRRNVWIRLDTVRAIHEAQISEHGGLAGIASIEALESALARPRNALTYDDPTPDIPARAACYAMAIVRAHPGFDGNKRVGFVLLELFLNLNGYGFRANDAEILEVMWSLAAGTTTSEEFTSWVRSDARRGRSR
ncbi:MAG: type II toxin-antitoxin system death-on-curing family toxin [Vulcanimicrobiaceae bacterium]